jgi:hypothetical protein
VTEQDRLLSDLEPVLLRPAMYFGDSPTVAVELAAFINGYMAHRSSFMPGGFGMRCCADPTKSVWENAQIFREQLLSWAAEMGSRGEVWRCCVNGCREHAS